jgi:hypothetical protein
MFERFRKAQRTEEERLIEAGILDGNESADEKSLAVRALQRTDGLPRVVGDFHLGTPIAGDAETEADKALLKRLDDSVKDKIRNRNSTS